MKHSCQDLRRAISDGYSDGASVESDETYGYVISTHHRTGCNRVIFIPVIFCPYCGEKIGVDSPHIKRPTMLAPDKGQAAVVKDNLGSAPCG